MRFVAPSREVFDRAVLRHPPLAAWNAVGDWIAAARFPSVAELNRDWDAGWRFVEQTPQLLADGLHYETRIHARAEIATRADNWHDFFNALVWRRFTPLKAALNRRQVAEIALMGDKQRSRAQCALTHFDEGGVIVVLRDRELLARWDAHDWRALFWEAREAWCDGTIRAEVFGHALLEMALVPGKLITGKAIAVVAGPDDGDAMTTVARAIDNGSILTDPQELRALPISGIPGWNPANDSAAFYAEAECFRPLRAGRIYPEPLRVA
ncbi:MAG TPA: DUF3025 domain-containing protein [Tahibacter sp.]|uniref:DUF3025 domain-containing protein n=1 Tax=Tahibacter sp. TaxID=2056211 RepID=UPI002C5C4F42|nr:DUF3025 domain-containing protein [Tahibacter sp.]HSX59995.1 DUF3025 domain-containing protein [Tahibacter sp.]